MAELEPFEDYYQSQEENAERLLETVEMGKQRKVKREQFLKYLREERDSRTAFLKLPFTIVFFAVHAARLLMHENIADSSMVQREMRGMLEGTTFEGISYTSGHKDLGDIDTVDDIWTYLNEVVMPLFIAPYGSSDPYRVLRYNQLVGGVQLQQVRRLSKNCADVYDTLPPYDSTGKNPLLSNFVCYPWDTESDDCFGPADRTGLNPDGWCPDSKTTTARRLNWGLDPKMAEALGQEPRRLDFVPDGGGKGGSTKGASGAMPSPDVTYSVYFYEYQGTQAALDKVQLIKDNNWIDVNTAWVGVRMLVFNPDLHMFLHITVHVYFPPSGALLPHITAQSFQPEPYQYKSVLGLDAAFFFLVFLFIANVAYNFVKAARSQGGVKSFFMNGWNWLDLGCTVGGLAVGVLWLVLISNLDVVKNKAMAVREADPTATDNSYPDTVVALHGEMNAISEYLMAYRLVLSWYTIFISMKFLESFSAQPRLAVVTKTIGSAGTDLFHFLVVFVTLFLSFVVAGMFLFGRRIWEFSSPDRACIMCFRALLGDFDWDELSEEHYITSALWFLLYIILMVLLMFNMLMAIIMDQYTEVKAEADSTKMLWEQSYDMAKEKIAVMQGKTVSIAQLIEHLKDMDEVDVDADMLVSACDGKMSDEQATELITWTLDRWQNDESKGIKISEAMQTINLVKFKVDKIAKKLESIMAEEREEHNYLAKQGFSTGAAGTAAAAAYTSTGTATPPVGGAPVSDDGVTTQQGEKYLTDKDGLLDELEGRMHKMESFVDESMKFTSFRGKDLRNRLAVIEDLIRSQHDVSMLKAEQSVWDVPPPRLGSQY